MAKDISKNFYGEATLTKLEIFEQYLTEWLPVFIQDPRTNEVTICDFFAGSGQDIHGVKGSPLRILQTIEHFREQITAKEIKIRVILNEKSAVKFSRLQSAVAETFDETKWKQKVTVDCHNHTFQNLFEQIYHQLQQPPSLLFLDQYGIKEITGDIFQMLIALKRTDFLFFISSSFIKRFAKTREFRKYFPELDPVCIKNARLNDIHRIILDHYKSNIPSGNVTKLYPFTLKKKDENNVYGLIFGSKHPLGVEKFLRVAWDKNKLNGEANFDIDGDIEKDQQLMSFMETKKPKREVFEDRLEEFINKQGTTNNLEVYKFTLEHGHLGSHAKKCVTRLKQLNKVECDGNIGFSYESCMRPKSELKVIKVIPNG